MASYGAQGGRDVRELPSHTLKAGCWPLPLGLVMRLEPSLEPWKEGVLLQVYSLPCPSHVSFTILSAAGPREVSVQAVILKKAHLS